jgi:hypothetical protein
METPQQSIDVIASARSRAELRNSLGLSSHTIGRWEIWDAPTAQAIALAVEYPATPLYRPADSEADFELLMPDVCKTGGVLDLNEAAAYIYRKMSQVDPASLRPGKRIWKSEAAVKRNLKASMDRGYLEPLTERVRGQMPYFSRFRLNEFFDW